MKNNKNNKSTGPEAAPKGQSAPEAEKSKKTKDAPITSQIDPCGTGGTATPTKMPSPAPTTNTMQNNEETPSTASEGSSAPEAAQEQETTANETVKSTTDTNETQTSPDANGRSTNETTQETENPTPPIPAEHEDPAACGSSAPPYVKKSRTLPKPPRKWQTMNGKAVLFRDVRTVLTFNSAGFHEKLLCDGTVLNLGDACVFNCTFCYVESVVIKLDKVIIDAFNLEHSTSLTFADVVIRRRPTINVLKSQLLNTDGSPKFNDPNDQRVVYTSTLVDAAGNMELLQETADSCNLIFEHTNWQVRILSKCSLLKLLIEKELIPNKYHHRLILGFSLGTLDDAVAKAIEVGTSPPSQRIKALHWLQDHGIRTFGMICPNLPQKDYDKFSKDVCDAIRVEKCEHVWAEVLNVRGKSKEKTLTALREAGLTEETALFESVFEGKDASKNWEIYSRATYEAHTRNIPKEKLRFLQYVDENSVKWWADRRGFGAVPIGTVAVKRLALAGGQSAPLTPMQELVEEDILYREIRETTVHSGVRASIAASRAIFEIYSYKDGLLWKKDYLSFDHYCQAKWGYAKSHGYRLLNTGRFVSSLDENGSGNDTSHDTDPNPIDPKKLPLNEGQIRPLLAVVPEPYQVACWDYIVETNDPATLTSAMVEDLAKAYVLAEKIGPPKAKKEIQSDQEREHLRTLRERERALREVEKLREFLAKLPLPKRFEPLLFGIRELVGQSPEMNTIDVESSVLDTNDANEPGLLASPQDTPTTETDDQHVA